MKTILIPLNKTPRALCEDLEGLGLFNLNRDKDGKAVGTPVYIDGISEQPKTESAFKHIWVYNQFWIMTHHRINLTEQGEKILNDNKITYTYDPNNIEAG